MQTAEPYMASKLLDRMASTLACERILAADLRAQMDDHQCVLTGGDRQQLWNLYDAVIKKIAVLEKIVRDDESPKNGIVGSQDVAEPVQDSMRKNDEARSASVAPTLFYYSGQCPGQEVNACVIPNPLSTTMDMQPVKKNLKVECRKLCERRKLPPYVTIRNEVKYDIAKQLGLPGVGDYSDFGPGQPAYQLVNKLMSENGYSRKREREGRLKK